jgi:UMF1 family MFS transporter
LPLKYDSFFAYCTSASVFLQIFFLPILGAISDYSNRRKRFLQLLTIFGAFCSIGLFFLTDGNLWLGATLYILANLAFGACMVLYNSFLLDIASEEDRDRVSSYGWGLGYLGGGLLLLFNLGFFTFRESLGVSTGMAVRICLASAGVWWLAFGQITFDRLRKRKAEYQLPEGETYFSIGFKQLKASYEEVKQLPETLKYLIAYLLYNDGVQTVIVVATIFGAEELKMESSSLIQVILMVQIVAFIGAFFFGKIAEWLGAKSAVMISLIIWSGIVIYAWYFLESAIQFWWMAAVVALVLGGTQALSRSLFSKMIPHGKESVFFSFYEMSERGTSWIGPLIFGLVNQFVGGLRYGILSLIVLFVSGMILLFFVDVKRASNQAKSLAV